MRLLHQESARIILLLFLCLIAGSVRAKDTPEDLKKIKVESVNATGYHKADLLNQVAFIYTNPTNYHADSALMWAEQALEFSKRLQYPKGYSRALRLCARISLQLSLPNKGLTYYNELYQFATGTNDEIQKAYAILGMGTAQWYQGKFGTAIITIEHAIDVFKSQGIEREIDDATMMLSSILTDMGNYEKAFDVAQRSLRLSMKSGDQANIILSLVQMGFLYRSIGDFETSMEYFKKAFAYKPPHEEWCYRHLCNRTGDLYLEKKNYDSAYYFYNQSLLSHAESKTSLLRMADYWFARNQFSKANGFYSSVYKDLKNGGEGNLVIFALLGMARVERASHNEIKALNYGYEALNYARQRDSKLTLRDAYQLLSSVYEDMQNSDSAFHYYKLFVNEKDDVITDQFKGRLYAYKQASRISLLESEKRISEQKLMGNRMLRNILAGGIFALVVLGMVIFWNISLKNKNEKLQHERVEQNLKRRAAELEMQALRAQMNPHFIFNALSSVNRFILKNDPDKASDYLTRFSRLIRLVLVNSQREVIFLEEEIEMLHLYLEMEQLRFKNAFEFTIHCTNHVDASQVTIPPLLVQPFCENAIWHGLMHKEEKGLLDISFSLIDNILSCTITDNGVGREKAAELGSKSAEKIKSLGLQLTRERLALFNEDNNVETSYTIEDIFDNNGKVTGTKVILHIRDHSLTPEKEKEVI